MDGRAPQDKEPMRGNTKWTHRGPEGMNETTVDSERGHGNRVDGLVKERRILLELNESFS
jgi:hypothetical protein